MVLRRLGVSESNGVPQSGQHNPSVEAETGIPKKQLRM